MEFRISDTFSDSLAKLSGDEQKAVKTTAFDLQMNPANPGMQFHRIEKSKDSNFWSIRVSRDIRLIVHKTGTSLLMCYVDHHDEAYQWAQRRKIERHPKTGAAQLVEVRETVKEITIPKYVEAEPVVKHKALLFESVSDSALLGYGIPEEWLGDVRTATEDTLFEITEHLPQEASEALLELATGNVPTVPKDLSEDDDPFLHPDAQRRFRVMVGSEELQRALDYPWEKWSVFLHPTQRDLVEREFNGPARISGSAGTGKTIVALHRAVHMARKDRESRVLLTTFSETLANALRAHLRRLIDNEPRLAERLEVHSIEGIGKRLYENNFERPKLAEIHYVSKLLSESMNEVKPNAFSTNFLLSEWTNVIDAWQLNTWEEYQNIKRLGRKKRLAEGQREILWSIFEKVRITLERDKAITRSEMFSRLAERLKEYSNPPFDFTVIDESQDIGVAELRFLSSLGAGRPNSLFFTGDLGQRIFQQPFSWKALGVEIRGRSRTLKINYRTSHEIRSYADRLLPTVLSDVDDNIEGRTGAISVFNSLSPMIKIYDSKEGETKAVSKWVNDLINQGYQPGEIGIIVRSDQQLQRAEAAIKSLDVPYIVLDDNMNTKSGHLSICTMQLAKGLEFRAVAVIACDDEVIPQQDRIESASDESDLEDVYQTERHLLYVACTRARDNLLVTGVDPASEFLDDLNTSHKKELGIS
jgi:superfamily I DNA/RNA helicase/mRNA-degrading endonuclease RelE of RelBE toxin-antitoxin system